MWLTLLGPHVDVAPMRLGGHELILQEVKWFWEVRKRMNKELQFLYLFKCFLSNHQRSGNIFVEGADSFSSIPISTTRFAQACAQKAWRGILGLMHPFSSENRGYVHSAIPNALLDNMLDRLLVYLYEVMNLLIPSDAPLEESSKLADEMIIQNTKVSQTRFF